MKTVDPDGAPVDIGWNLVPNATLGLEATACVNLGRPYGDDEISGYESTGYLCEWPAYQPHVPPFNLTYPSRRPDQGGPGPGYPMAFKRNISFDCCWTDVLLLLITNKYSFVLLSVP